VFEYDETIPKSSLWATLNSLPETKNVVEIQILNCVAVE
jgi:hypothetical protein